ncbi:zinc-binding dehydrogenase, partial [Pseudomonas aeruginosa]|uniref:zinc-binding dehydrogenase n=1 Tax=Pseudomonas aeruginosa TaxID=287 RepID=UPI003CF9D31E
NGVAVLVGASVQNGEVTYAIADGGTMVIVRAWSGDPGRGIRKEHVSVSQGAGRADLLAKLRQVIEKGVLTPRVARSYPAEEAAAAHRAMEAGGVRGRLILTF